MKSHWVSIKRSMIRSPLEQMLEETADWEHARRVAYFQSRIIDELSGCSGMRAEDLRDIWLQLPRQSERTWRELLHIARPDHVTYHVETIGPTEYTIVGTLHEHRAALFRTENKLLAEELSALLNEAQPFFAYTWVRCMAPSPHPTSSKSEPQHPATPQTP